MKKTCRTCGENKELNCFVKRTKTTYQNQCKECYNLSKRKTPIRPKPKEGFKFCASCKEEKALSEYNVRFITNLQQYKPFSYCITCEREKDKNKYHKKCEMCNKEYKSNNKNSVKCFDCHVELMKQDKVMYKYKVRDFRGEKNPMYGKQRFEEENPNYKHGLSNKHRYKHRLITGYGIWRKNVYKRDNYTCQCCFKKSNGDIVAHHLNGYHWYSEGRTNVDNGVTLCESCHNEFHSIYGKFNNTAEQFEQFKIYRSKSECQ